MSVGVPGGYRGVSWRPRYTLDRVAILLPTVWGMKPWGEKPIAKDRCTQGAGKCTHNCNEDQHYEGCIVDGDHRTCHHIHGGHRQCGKCTCVDPSSRRSNDGRESDLSAEIIDIQAAWASVSMPWSIAQPLILAHQDGMSTTEISRETGVPRKTVGDRIIRGYQMLADYLNGEVQDEG